MLMDSADHLARLSDLREQIQALGQHSQQVETMLAQTLGVLSRLGNQAPFNMDKLAANGYELRARLDVGLQKVAAEFDEMAQVIRTSALITTSLEIERVLEEVLDTVISLTGAERAYLLLLKGEELQTVASRNNKGLMLDPSEMSFSRGVIKTALQEGQPLISTNAAEDERFQEMQSIIRNDMRSIMVIPMMLQGIAMGVLYLDNRLTAAVFHKKSIPVLTAFANQAAIAIENARLFERVKESLERTQREVRLLRVQIDQNRLRTQVDEITSTDYFNQLASMAKEMRGRSADNAGDK
jgi:GAF domain-containing protein